MVESYAWPYLNSTEHKTISWNASLIGDSNGVFSPALAEQGAAAYAQYHVHDILMDWESAVAALNTGSADVLRNHILAAKWFRARYPQAHCAFYNVPQTQYWPYGGSGVLTAHLDNIKGLLPYIDGINLSFYQPYTFAEYAAYGDGYQTMIGNAIRSVRSYWNGPITVAIWPRYHDQGVYPFYSVPQDEWKNMARYVLDNDACILWWGADAYFNTPSGGAQARIATEKAAAGFSGTDDEYLADIAQDYLGWLREVLAEYPS